MAFGVIGLPVTARDRILRCSPPVVGTTRAGPLFIKMKGQRLQIPHLIGGRKTNRHLDVIQPFLFLLGKNGEVHPNRPMKNKRRAKRQWRAKRMRNGHGEKSVWRRSSRAHSLRFLGPKQCSVSWPNQGFGASCYATKKKSNNI